MTSRRSSPRWAGESYDLRLVLTRGGQRIVLAEPIPPLLDRLRLALVVDTPRRVLRGAKTLSYAGNMLARRLAVERGYDEALLVTPRGRVLELQNAAFFYVARDGALCTPPLTHDILDSITRRVLLKRLEVEERPCTRAEVLECREAFAAGTGREVQPVGAIETHTFDEVPGPLTRAAQDAFWDEVKATTGAERRESSHASQAESIERTRHAATACPAGVTGRSRYRQPGVARCQAPPGGPRSRGRAGRPRATSSHVTLRVLRATFVCLLPAASVARMKYR